MPKAARTKKASPLHQEYESRRKPANKDVTERHSWSVYDREIKRKLPILDLEEWGSDDDTHLDDASWAISWAQKLNNSSKSYHPILFMNFLDEIVSKKLYLPLTVQHILSELDGVFESLLECDEFESDENPLAAAIFDRVTSHIDSLETLKIYDSDSIENILGWEKTDYGYSMKELE